MCIQIKSRKHQNGVHCVMLHTNHKFANFIELYVRADKVMIKWLEQLFGYRKYGHVENVWVLLDDICVRVVLKMRLSPPNAGEASDN